MSCCDQKSFEGLSQVHDSKEALDGVVQAQSTDVSVALDGVVFAQSTDADTDKKTSLLGVVKKSEGVYEWDTKATLRVTQINPQERDAMDAIRARGDSPLYIMCPHMELQFEVHRHFPKPGIVFRSLRRILSKGAVFMDLVESLALGIQRHCVPGFQGLEDLRAFNRARIEVDIEDHHDHHNGSPNPSSHDQQSKDSLVPANGPSRPSSLSASLSPNPPLRRVVLFVLDSRGFLFSALQTVLSTRVLVPLEVVICMVAKKGKLPGMVVSSDAYAKEYGSGDVFEVSSLFEPRPNDLAFVVDDLLATGGSAKAVALLITKKLKIELAGFVFAGILPVRGFDVLRNTCPGVPVVTGVLFAPIPDPNPTLTQYLLKRASVDEFYRAEDQELASERSSSSANKISIVVHDVGDSHSDSSSLDLMQICWPRTNNIKHHPLSSDAVLLLAHPSMYSLARLLIRLYPGRYQYRPVHFRRFSDGTHDIDLKPWAGEIRGRHVVQLMSNTDDATWVAQLHLQRIIGRHEPLTYEIWHPYISGATHERITEEGVLASAETTFQIFSSRIPMVNGKPVAVVVDIHALGIQFYGHDDMGYHFLNGLPRFLDLIEDCLFDGRTFIAFPDQGAYKRFDAMLQHWLENKNKERMARGRARASGQSGQANPRTTTMKHIPVLIFNKTRIGDKRIVVESERVHWPMEKDWQIAGGHAERYEDLEHGIIIDDLALSCGTLLEVAEKLKHDMHVRYIDCYVTHGRFPDQSWRKLTIRGEPFDHVYFTDSVPQAELEVMQWAGQQQSCPIDDPHYVAPKAGPNARQSQIATSTGIEHPFYVLPIAPLLAESRESTTLETKSKTLSKPLVVLVASKEPVKTNGILAAFEYVFPNRTIELHAVPCRSTLLSAVPAQPRNVTDGAASRLIDLLVWCRSTSGRLNLDDYLTEAHDDQEDDQDNVEAPFMVSIEDEIHDVLGWLDGTWPPLFLNKSNLYIGRFSNTPFLKFLNESLTEPVTEGTQYGFGGEKGMALLRRVISPLWIGYSKGVPIDQKYVEQSAKTGYAQTAGHFLIEDQKAQGLEDAISFLHADAHDWFAMRGSKSRFQVIKETTVRALYEMLVM